MREIAQSGQSGLPEGARAFLADNRSRTPEWAIALQTYFPEVGDVHNTSSRFVLFLPVGSRLFAICFGYGNASLSSAAIDPNFGLRYAARALNSDTIYELDSRRISSTARSQSVQTLGGVRLSDMDVPLLGEFVRKLSGKLDEGASALIDGISTIVAGDSVAFKAAIDLDEIRRVLSIMLEVTESGQAKNEFEFVDALEPLRATDERVTALEDQLCREINARVRADVEDPKLLVSLVPPEMPDVDALDQVRLLKGGEAFNLEDLSIEALVRVLRDNGITLSRASLRSIKLAVVDGNGRDGPSSPLRSWLVFETDDGGERFILTLGRWFGLNEDFAARLDADVAAVADLTASLSLPDWPAATRTEGAYNRDVARTDSRFLLLDTVRFLSDGDEVEVCDLLSVDGHLVHVKKWNKSATLSHLFSQGLVSLETLNGDPAYAANVDAHVRSNGSDHIEAFLARPRRVVYAVAMRGSRELPGSLPTFSKVNLRDFVQRVRSRGGDPSIARIQML
jgi:uncharacterized protein (TIGR04141 family)